MSEIILEFESFELEPDSNTPGGVFCRYDRLEIWDGFPDGKRKMGCDMQNHYSAEAYSHFFKCQSGEVLAWSMWSELN